MPRTLNARRLVRRAMAPVCAFLTIALLVFTALGDGPSAQAQPRPAAPAALIATEPPRAPETAPSIPPRPRTIEKPALPTARETQVTASGTDVLVYPPVPVADVTQRGAPLVMMLHGMCGDPESTCDFWSRAGREGSFLVCPEGNVTCGGARDWAGTGEVKAGAIDETFAAVDRAYGPNVAHERGDILIGFSRGAFVARDVVYARPGRFRGLILIGALMRPDAARLRASGIHRVVMAAGEYDGARPAMQRAAASMTAAGLPSRYISLGRIPHALPANLESILRDALGWVRGAEE